MAEIGSATKQPLAPEQVRTLLREVGTACDAVELYAIVLAEEAPRRYDPVRRAPTRARAAEGALAALARLRA